MYICSKIESAWKCAKRLRQEGKGDVEGVTAVSYTHLDVYKRQAMVIPSPLTIADLKLVYSRNSMGGDN